MQQDKYLSSVTPIGIQIDQQKITITEVMLVILKIKNDNNNNNNNNDIYNDACKW